MPLFIGQGLLFLWAFSEKGSPVLFCSFLRVMKQFVVMFMWASHRIPWCVSLPDGKVMASYIQSVKNVVWLLQLNVITSIISALYVGFGPSGLHIGFPLNRRTIMSTILKASWITSHCFIMSPLSSVRCLLPGYCWEIFAFSACRTSLTSELFSNLSAALRMSHFNPRVSQRACNERRRSNKRPLATGAVL